VATLPEQSLIGEVEFLDMLPASADVVILKETHLIELNNAALTGLMKQQPRLGYVLMSEIARSEGQRLRAMNSK
jgi:CRP-like cAMP-binding protein